MRKKENKFSIFEIFWFEHSSRFIVLPTPKLLCSPTAMDTGVSFFLEFSFNWSIFISDALPNKTVVLP